MLPDAVDIKSHLMDRTTRLKHFFTTQSKKAPCISYSRIPPQFWKTIHNNNRSNERRIGRLKNIVNDKIGDEPSQMNETDMRLRALLYNMELDKADWLFFPYVNLRTNYVLRVITANAIIPLCVENQNCLINVFFGNNFFSVQDTLKCCIERV